MVMITIIVDVVSPLRRNQVARKTMGKGCSCKTWKDDVESKLRCHSQELYQRICVHS